MEKITRQQLLKIAPSYPLNRIDEDLKTLNEWNLRFCITTELRMAHFLGQIAHESGGFRYVEENLNYSAARLQQVFPKYFKSNAQAKRYEHNAKMTANRVYASRLGNGNELSGDGYRFRGRGYIQITGRDNYRAYQNSGFCNGNLLEHPEWLCSSPGRMKSAMWFWFRNGLNIFADKDDIYEITRRVNGGLNGIQQRTSYTQLAKSVLNKM